LLEPGWVKGGDSALRNGNNRLQRDIANWRIQVSHTSSPRGIEPGSLMTRSKCFTHWTSETVYECGEIEGSRQDYHLLTGSGLARCVVKKYGAIAKLFFVSSQRSPQTFYR
jgi:hypothetical protein